MWRRIPDNQKIPKTKLQRLEPYLNPTFPVMSAFIITLAVFFIGKIGGVYVEEPPPSAIENAYICMLYFVFGVIYCYFAQFFYVKSHKNVICNSCHKIGIYASLEGKHCECGGAYESCSEWEWIPDNSATRPNSEHSGSTD